MSARTRVHRHRRRDRERSAVEAITVPPSERFRHDKITLSEKSIGDSRGAISRPWKVENLLDRWEAEGKLTNAQRQAGEAFRVLFRAAQFEALRCADVGRIPNLARASRSWGALSITAERARNRLSAVWEALGGLNSEPSSVIYHCLGEERSLREWSIVYGFKRRNGAASVLLIEALCRLETALG
jgi:hypothetical protein